MRTKRNGHPGGREGVACCFNLYYGLHARYERRYLWLDLVRLVHRIRPTDRILAVRYFTALVRDDLRNSLLPEAVRDPATGRIYQRPANWR